VGYEAEGKVKREEEKKEVKIDRLRYDGQDE